MFFRDIKGKEELIRHLTKIADQGEIPHAQIFLSKEGQGGLAMALAYASYIMCENPQNGDSCGECKQCKMSHKYIHPDIHYSFPVVKAKNKKREDTTSTDFLPEWRTAATTQPFMSKAEWFDMINAENTAPNINVRECNELLRKLNMMPFETDCKVLIIWLPEYLGKEGNRLLKFIEEPTDRTYIILATENSEQILPTILSRCQLVKIPPFTAADIVSFLSENTSIDVENATQIANLVDGNLSMAIAILNNQATDYSKLLVDWMRTAYKLNPMEINEWIKSVEQLNKEEQKNFLEYGLHFFRQFNYMYLTQSDAAQLTPKEISIATNMSKIINIQKSQKITDIINELLQNIGRNINLKINLFADTLTMGKIMRVK